MNEVERTISQESLEHLGDGEIAYIRPLMSEEVHELFPEAPELAPGLQLWALLSAEGRPILLTDDKDVAVANAREHDLDTVSVH
jgi:hypothetical protein